MHSAAFNPLPRPADAAVLATIKKLSLGFAAPTQSAAAIPRRDVI
jgi:hypothetical protein